MKKTYSFLLNSCAISVLITSIFFLFAKISNPNSTPAIHIGKYFLILLFSLILILTNQLFLIKNFPKSLSTVIHYLITLLSFTLIFLPLNDSRPMYVFVYLAVFTIAYAFLFAIVIGVRKAAINLGGSMLSKTNANKEKAEYSRRYK